MTIVLYSFKIEYFLLNDYIVEKQYATDPPNYGLHKLDQLDNACSTQVMLRFVILAKFTYLVIRKIVQIHFDMETTTTA